MEAMLGQSRRGVNPRSGQVTIQTQPPLAEHGQNPRSASNLVFFEKTECVHSFSTQLEDDRGVRMTGLAVDKEHMFVADYVNNRTKVFTHKGQYKFDIKLNYPCDVAVSQTGHLYITSHGDSCVQVYSTRGQQVTTMGQGLLKWPWGITLNRQGHVMVCDSVKKSIFTFHADSGQLLNTIPLNMCVSPVYITVNSLNYNIAVADRWGHCVHVLSPTGDHLYQYGSSESDGVLLMLPRGVCTDNYGHIFFADMGNRRIVALSPQGQFIRYIVTEDDGFEYPVALTINPAGQLVVGDEIGKVETFKYIQLKEGNRDSDMSQQQRISESPASQGSEEIETDTKCVLTVNQFSKHSLSCDSKRLSALVFGSFQPRHVPLLKLMVCCVNDTRNEVENVKFKAKESFLMEMLALEKKFEILTCEYSDSEDKESYDVSLLLDGFETGWMMQNDCPKKVIKYVKLLKNEAEYATYALSPKMADAPDVFVCKIHIKQKVSEDQEEDIKLLTSTEFDIHWKLPVAPHMDLNNLGSYSGGPTCLRSAPQRSSHPLPGREVQRHGGNHFQLRPNQQYYQQDPYLQNQPRIQSDNGSQQDDFQSQTAREMVVPGQYQQNQPSLQPNLRNQWLQQGNFQSQTLPGESTGPNISYHQQGESQHSRLPQEPVTDHHLEEQGGDHFQTRRKSGHDFPSLPPQQDPVAAEDQDQGVTDPQTIKTMGNQALNQAHGDNQLERLPTSVPHEIAGVLGQIPSNTDNKQFTLLYQVNHNYFSEKASVTHMKENDVTTSFHKHIPPRVKKRLNETLCQSDVWDQVKKMYGIPDETPCPHDVVASLLSHVEGSIASFISVLLKLKERHREGQKEIPQNLIDEVKDGLQSEMEYKKLRQNKIRFAEELYIDIGRILDYFNQDDMVRDEEITVLKNTAKENPRDACRKLFERLIASSPEKQPIKCLKDALRQCQYWHLGDELEVSKQDVEDELQKHEVGGDRPSCEEPLAIGI